MSPQSMLRRALTFTHLPKSVPRNGLRGRRPYANNAAAAAAAEEPNPGGNKVRGRRLSKKDLQALVEPFVNEYRAMNAGLFPSFKYTQQQVGGSYYRVRGILQELQYRDKISPSCGGIELSLGREGVRGSEALTEVRGASARTVSEVEDDADLSVTTDGCLEAKEESQTCSLVEILSEEVITAGTGSDLDATHNIGKANAEKSSLKNPDIVEEQKNNQSVSIAPGCEMLQGGFEVISHSHDKSQDSKMEEAQADRHDYISEEKHLQIGETTTAFPSSDDSDDDISKLDLNDSERKMKQQEEIPQAERLDSITADKQLPLEADKLSEDLTGRPADDAEPPKTTNLWGAMKSLADGIISIFRKQ